MFFAFSIGLTKNTYSQTIENQAYDKKKLLEHTNKVVFNEEAAILQAKAKGIKPSEIKGYVEFLKNDFSSKNALKASGHSHTPYDNSANLVDETVIYLNPNKTMSIGCPNMSFDNYDFSNWTGGIGTVSTGGASGPIYTVTGGTILNPAGNNVSVRNTANYHTIMTRPTATNNVYPNCSSFGYDSLACKLSGATSISQIPFVSPYSFDPVSVRLQQAVANYRACRLKYITTVTSTNKTLAFSYAVVLNDPAAHTAGESPYFKVEVKNEGTGLILPGCTSYTFNPKTATLSDSLFTSSIAYPTFEIIKYRKWKFYTVDLSALPLGTNVSVNFEVGGCSQSGHFGYAYVDAECGGIGAPYANMCSGSTFATLVAPPGYNSYQWFSPLPAGTLIPGATNDTLIASPASVGQIYTVQMVSPGGCTLTLTDTVKLTTVSIINLLTTSSCPGGSSGTAYVLATGSNGVYNYTWTATSGPLTGSVVSTSQTATGLSPGTYNILVTSTTCGLASANVVVGVSPAFPSSQTKPFCGNSTFIPAPGGAGYKWYGNSALSQTLIPAPAGTNDTLYIPTANAGDVYTLVYSNASGCKDSTRYTLVLIPGGSAYYSSINNVCPGNTNGSAGISLSTGFPSPYNYYVTGSGGVVLNTTTAATTAIASPLAAGVYTSVVNDGVCLYRNTFTITTIQTNFTVTATNTVLCFPIDTAKVYLNFGATAPTVCGVDPALCGGPATQLFNTGPFTSNSTISYPTPFGNFYTYAKHQFLVTKADLNAVGITAGKISSLAFNVLNLNLSITSYPNYSIKMGCTNLTNMPDAGVTPTAFFTGLTTVYTTPSQPITTGWVTHNFSQSYVWDGISNVIIEVCFGMNTAFNWIDNASVELKQVPYISTMFYREDGSPVCAGPQLADNGGAMVNGKNMLPNMRFGYCGSSIPASSYSVTVSSNGLITNNYGNDSLKVVPTFTAPLPGSVPTIYTITVTNPQGLCTKTQTIAIVYPSSVINLTTVPTSTTICEGSPITLSAFGALNYNWSYYTGGGLTPISTSQTFSIIPAPGTNSYIVTGTTPCPATPDTKTITINVLPKANLIISPLQDAVKCLDRPFVITAGVSSGTSGNAGTPYTYTWSAISSTTSLGSGSTYTTNATVTTTLVVTVNGNCAYSTKDTIVVSNLIDNLTVSIIDSSTTCANTPFSLTGLVTNGYPYYNYNWNIDAVPTSISTSNTLNYVSPATEGTYVISLTVNDSCGYNRVAYEVITVLPPCTVSIPNVITPNGDNVNDFFVIHNLEHHPNSSLTIFDRWGIKVYENSNYNNEWKAEGNNDGTYFYILDVPEDKKYNGFISVFHSK